MLHSPLCHNQEGSIYLHLQVLTDMDLEYIRIYLGNKSSKVFLIDLLPLREAIQHLQQQTTNM